MRQWKQGRRAFGKGLLDPFFFGIGQPRGRKDFYPTIFIFIMEGTCLDVSSGTQLVSGSRPAAAVWSRGFERCFPWRRILW